MAGAMLACSGDSDPESDSPAAPKTKSPPSPTRVDASTDLPHDPEEYDAGVEDGDSGSAGDGAARLPSDGSVRQDAAVCTSFTYGAWGPCQANGTQTRSVQTASPTGCVGGSPALSQKCTPIDGAALYQQNCYGCHRNGKKGSSVASIEAAIAANRGGMGKLKTLTKDQLTAISKAP
jgi:hypothetical protein